VFFVSHRLDAVNFRFSDKFGVSKLGLALASGPLGLKLSFFQRDRRKIIYFAETILPAEVL